MEFTDANGSNWAVGIDISALERVRESGNDVLGRLDLLQESVSAIVSDPVEVARVLYAICLPQAKRRNVSRDEFMAALDADALHEGLTCILEALRHFCPNPAIRDVVNREVGAVIDHLRGVGEPQQTAGDSSTERPESAASTHPDSPSDNSS